jgi:hypothetical protein
VSKPEKVRLAFSVELVGQVIQVVQAVLQNGTSLIIETL